VPLNCLNFQRHTKLIQIIWFDSPLNVSQLYSSLNCSHLQMTGSTYPGQVRQLFGGVGRNLADCLSRLDHVPLFISAVGDDLIGQLFHLNHPHMVCATLYLIM